MTDPPAGPDRRRNAPIEMDPEAFRRSGYEIVDRLAELIRTIADRPVTRGLSREAIHGPLRADRPLPSGGEDAEALLRRAADLVLDLSLYNGHPRFWGYITSPPAPIGILGDLLASGVNANLGAWKLSPVASEIEGQTVRWIAELLGYPTDCGGLLVSGGNVANFVGFLAGRAARAGWDVRTLGLRAASEPPLRFYASTETHTWVQKAADLFGFGTEAIGWIPADAEGRMRVSALRERIERDRADGMRPFLAVGTAGSVSTGAVDPLFQIAEVCREAGLWFHVDGAYGGFAASIPGVPDDLRAIGLADSVAVDPHKWLYAPLEAGCTLVRDAAALPAAFSYHPSYYHFGDEGINYNEYGLQNSRGFRALKVWLMLQHVGRDGYARMIADDIALAGSLFEEVSARGDLEALTRGLSIVTFRYVPPALRAASADPDTAAYLDRLNLAIQDRLERGGEAFVSGAVVGGAAALRACIVNFRTARSDVRALPELVSRIGRELHAAPPPRR
jgi:aromatic-L-amino-acid decarboxylase